MEFGTSDSVQVIILQTSKFLIQTGYLHGCNKIFLIIIAKILDPSGLIQTTGGAVA